MALLASCLLTAGCRPERRAAAATPFTDALLAAAQSWSDQPFDASATRAELDRIASRVQRAILADPARAPSDQLTRVIFGELAFAREVDDPDLRYVLLPGVLQARRGSCVGLGSLALALAERLRLPIQAVMVPGHFFVRVADGSGHRNLELLRRGEAMPDGWYAERYPIAGGTAPAYGRALTPSEVRGVVEYDAGNQRKRGGQLRDAQRAYRAASEHFPQFAEAHASLGAIAQLLGQLDRARLHYDAARRAHPNLPGLAHNLRMLDAEPQPPQPAP